MSHFESRFPPHRKNSLQFCECGRSLNDISICAFCQESEDVVKCAQEMTLEECVLEILKLLQCGACELRFPDKHTLQTRANSVHATSSEVRKRRKASNIHPQSMKVDELKKELQARGASVSGDKAHLVRRLEGIVAESK